MSTHTLVLLIQLLLCTLSGEKHAFLSALHKCTFQYIFLSRVRTPLCCTGSPTSAILAELRLASEWKEEGVQAHWSYSFPLIGGNANAFPLPCAPSRFSYLAWLGSLHFVPPLAPPPKPWTQSRFSPAFP